MCVQDYKKMTIAQLKSALTTHNVDLPATAQKKDVYLELYRKHVLHQ